MNKILVVPDIHGRSFWIEPCQNWQGSIVFLGDYHDPYPFQTSVNRSLDNLEKLVDFVTSNKDRCTCLFGNHDNYGFSKSIPSGCRHDNRNHVKVHDLLKKLNLQIIKVVDPNIIFSHSGILPNWLLEHAIPNWYDVEYLDINNEAFSDISPYRGGVFPDYREHQVGSCLFGDVREYDEQPHIPGYYQIFGHTQLENDPIIKKDYACLDCRECFVVNTETKEIKPYGQEVLCKS